MSIERMFVQPTASPHVTNRWSRLYLKLMNSNAWAMEQLPFGVRAWCVRDRNGVALYSHSGNEMVAVKCGQIIKGVEIPINTMLDGYVTMAGGVHFLAHDVLWLSGAHLTGLKYHRRRKALCKLYRSGSLGQFAGIVQSGTSGQAKAEVYQALGDKDRGMMFKNIASNYPAVPDKQTPDWIVCKIDGEL